MAERVPVAPTGKALTTPAVEMRPIVALLALTNQRLASGPVVMLRGVWIVGPVTRDTAPAGVTFPTRPRSTSVNHTLPSGPDVTPRGLYTSLPVNFVTVPLGVIRAMLEFPV